MPEISKILTSQNGLTSTIDLSATGTTLIVDGLQIHEIPVDSLDATNKSYVDSIQLHSEWQQSVLDRSNTPPVSPSIGNRYLIIATASGDWTGKENDITEYMTDGWHYFTPSTSTAVTVDSELDGIYQYGASGWVKKYWGSFNDVTVWYETTPDTQISHSLGIRPLSITFEWYDNGKYYLEDGLQFVNKSSTNPVTDTYVTFNWDGLPTLSSILKLRIYFRR